jgi:hypothetical protein
MKNSIIPNKNLSADDDLFINTNHYIKDWVIPFYHVKLSNWQDKKNTLIKIWDRCAKSNMVHHKGHDQITDYDNDNTYHLLIDDLLHDDLCAGVLALGYVNARPHITTAWYQIYNNNHHHAPHNHGLGSLSIVVFVDYCPDSHSPTTFIAPFTSLKDGNVLEYIPSGITEGSMIIFPSALMHYAPTNQTDEERMIMAANINIGDE